MDEFAIALVTSTKTRTGATPLRAENADVLRGRGPDEGERGAQNERDENLPDERAVNDRLGKPEDAAKTLGHDGKLLLCDGGGPRTGVRRTRAALDPAV